MNRSTSLNKMTQRVEDEKSIFAKTPQGITCCSSLAVHYNSRSSGSLAVLLLVQL